MKKILAAGTAGAGAGAGVGFGIVALAIYAGESGDLSWIVILFGILGAVAGSVGAALKGGG